jgi:anti-anti-sigma factor
MDAKVEDLKGVFLVSLSGQLNFESADSLRARCEKVFSQKKVIFNLKNLSFVGSSGITPFLDLLRHLLQANGNGLKVCAVGTEFMRLFEAGQLNGLEVYENESQARLAFDFVSSMQNQTQAQPQPEAFNSAIEMVQPFGLDVKINE